MLGYVGKVMKKSGDAIIGAANSSIVKGVSKVGTGALKIGVEGAAGIADKTLKTAKKVVPKLKNIDGQKINDGIGKAVNKTMVGLDDDYRKIGSIGKTTYAATGKTFGLVDAVTDRAKTYVDGAVGIIKGHQYEIGPMVNNNIKNEWLSNKVKKMGTIHTGLVKTGADNFMPFGLKATGIGTRVAIGASLISGVPDAAEQWSRGRQGTNTDSSPVSLAPQVPAYANNGGATGDLVFALNNLRHGGMM